MRGAEADRLVRRVEGAARADRAHQRPRRINTQGTRGARGAVDQLDRHERPVRGGPAEHIDLTETIAVNVERIPAQGPHQNTVGIHSVGEERVQAVRTGHPILRLEGPVLPQIRGDHVSIRAIRVQRLGRARQIGGTYVQRPAGLHPVGRITRIGIRHDPRDRTAGPGAIHRRVFTRARIGHTAQRRLILDQRRRARERERSRAGVVAARNAILIGETQHIPGDHAVDHHHRPGQLQVVPIGEHHRGVHHRAETILNVGQSSTRRHHRSIIHRRDLHRHRHRRRGGERAIPRLHRKCIRRAVGVRRRRPA